MNGCDTALHCGHGVGGGEPVIVVRMKIKILLREAITHIANSSGHFLRTHHTKRIRQHQVADVHGHQAFHHPVHVIATVAIPIGPVFQININQQILVVRISHSTPNVIQMLIKGLA